MGADWNKYLFQDGIDDVYTLFGRWLGLKVLNLLIDCETKEDMNRPKLEGANAVKGETEEELRWFREWERPEQPLQARVASIWRN